jgi:hypothetical protein
MAGGPVGCCGSQWVDSSHHHPDTFDVGVFGGSFSHHPPAKEHGDPV